MFTRNRLAAVLVAMVALAAVPSVASAAAPQLRGVVSGSPYGASNGSMAVPVLFSKMTVRSAGLKSPVGVVILKRTQKVALPGGATSLPVNLRTGDRFKGSGTVSDINRRTFYPRVPMNKDTQVYFRSKEMSLGELTAAVAALQNALAALQNRVTDLAKYTYAGFQQLLAEIDALKKQIAALNIPAAADLSGLQKQIDDLKTQLNGVIESLKDYAKLTDVDKKIADAIAGLNLLSTSDVTNILNTLNFDTTALAQFVDDTVTGLLADPASALTTAVKGIANTAITNADLATNTDLAAANAKIDALTTRLNTLCTKLNTPGVLAILGIANLNGACS